MDKEERGLLKRILKEQKEIHAILEDWYKHYLANLRGN